MFSSFPRLGALSSSVPRPSHVASGAVVLAVLGSLAASISGRSMNTALRSFQGSLMLVALIASAVPILGILRDQTVNESLRAPWRLFGGSLVLFGVLQSMRLLFGDSPAPLPLMAVELAHNGMLFTAVALLPCGIVARAERVGLAIDLLITTLSVFTIGLALLPQESVYPSGSIQRALIAEPLFDLILVAAAVALYLRGLVDSWHDAMAPLAGGLLVHVVLTATRFTSNAITDPIGFSLGLTAPVLVGMAAMRYHRALSSGVRSRCASNRPHPALPMLSAGGALLALLWSWLTNDHADRSLVVAGAAAVAMLTAVRELFAMQSAAQNDALTDRHQSDRRLAALVRYGTDLVAVIAEDTSLRYASPSALAFFDASPAQLIDTVVTDRIHEQDRHAVRQAFRQCAAGVVQPEATTARVRDGSGDWRWLEIKIANLLDEPSVNGLVLSARDVTERKQLETRLTAQVLQDPLTGLGNRNLFNEHLNATLQRPFRRAFDAGVLFLDLDHFKVVNDTLGHAQGDVLLATVGKRIAACVRHEDTVARLGGDEFAVLMKDLEQPEIAHATARRILKAIERPIELDGREVFVSASIGIAWASPGQTADQLVTDADLAMYGAKADGRGRVRQFEECMRTGIAERHELEADIRRALERSEFELVYQPVVDLQSGIVKGLEALIRWRHPDKGIVMPGRFIAAAEESDLIDGIGRFVLQQATKDARAFRLIPGAGHLRVAINLSARHLVSNEVIDDVKLAMVASGIDGDAIAIELTESVLATNEALMVSRLQALRSLGISISLDDFGTGYSSLAYLQRFPIDVLKIDRGFVQRVGSSHEQDAVTRAIIAIGAGLGMHTIAEGIEDSTQLKQLQAMGCNMGQGYLISRPLPVHEIVERLCLWHQQPITKLLSGDMHSALESRMRVA